MTDEEIKAIERLKSIDENTEEYDGNLFKTDFETVLNLIQKQKEEIEKKDKIIDLMAEEILYENNCSGKLDFEIYKDKEEVIKDFEKKAEEDK